MMMFTLFLSLFLVLAPQVAHSPSGEGTAQKNEPLILETSDNVGIFLEQKEGVAPEGGLRRAAERGPQKKAESQSLGIETTALASLVADGETGVILFEKNFRKKLSLASITKLMTALVFLDTGPDWNKKIKLIKADEKEGGIFYARAGEELTVEDLFNIMLVGSINNAAMALARSAGMSEEDFVQKMNQKASELKLENTFFADPTGLDPQNIGTAEDVAKLISYALENEKIKEVVTKKMYVFSSRPSGKRYYVKSTDELLGGFLNENPYRIIGGKTGYIEESGYNLALGVENDGHRIIVVVMGSKTIEDRFQEAKGLSVWAFENYDW